EGGQPSRGSLRERGHLLEDGTGAIEALLAGGAAIVAGRVEGRELLVDPLELALGRGQGVVGGLDPALRIAAEPTMRLVQLAGDGRDLGLQLLALGSERGERAS